MRVVQDNAGAFQLEYLLEPPTEWEHRHSLAGGLLFADGEVVATLPAIVE